MKTLLSLKNVSCVEYIGNDDRVELHVHYFENEPAYRIGKDTRKLCYESTVYVKEKYAKMYETIKNALEKGDIYIEIEL